MWRISEDLCQYRALTLKGRYVVFKHVVKISPTAVPEAGASHHRSPREALSCRTY